MGRPTKYPWATWFRRSELCLIRGQDYNCQPYAMAIQVRRNATLYNRRVNVEILGDVLMITIYRRRSKRA